MTPFDQALLAAIVTWIISPLMFNIFSRVIYKNSLQKFPVSQFDFLSNVVLLPTFNAVAVNLGVFYLAFDAYVQQSLIYSLLGAIIITAVFIYYRKNIAEHNDWSRPNKGEFNFGGWYHTTYFFIQTYFIIFSLINLYQFIVLWVPIIGFIGLFIQRIIEIKEQKTQQNKNNF